MAYWIPPENISVDPKVPDGFPITFSNYTVVQTLSGEFIISFFQAIHPVITAEPQVKKVTTVPAHCVARIALSPVAIQGLLTAVTELLATMAQQSAKA